MTVLGPSRLTFGGPCADLRRRLVERGLGERLFRDEGLNLGLAWDVSDGALFEDADTHALLSDLIGQGVVFLERYAAADGPAELMRMLRADGLVPAFDSLILRGPGDWELIHNP